MEQKSIEKQIKKLESITKQLENNQQKLNDENLRLKDKINKILKQLDINKNNNILLAKKLKLSESQNYDLRNEISLIKNQLRK